MRVPHTGVYDRYDNAGGVVNQIPAFRCVNISVGRPATLTCVVQCPERTVLIIRVVRLRNERVNYVVRLGIFHQPGLPVSGGELPHISAGRQANHLQVSDLVERADRSRSICRVHICQHTKRQILFRLHQKLIRAIRRLSRRSELGTAGTVQRNVFGGRSGWQECYHHCNGG